MRFKDAKLVGGVLVVGMSLFVPAALAVPLQPGDRTVPAPSTSTIPSALRPAADALAKRDFETAIKLARAYVAQHPDQPAGHELVGTAAIALRRWPDAEKALNEALKLQPNRSGTLVLLSYVALEQGKLPDAERFARRATDVAPNVSAAH